MRLTKRMKSILIKKLSESLTEKITLEEYNEAFLFLDRWGDAHNIVPYGIFEKGYWELLTETDSGIVFDKWLTLNTSNIEKDFNKGRKVVRLIKDLICDQRESLAFNLSSNKILTTMLTVLFVKYNPDESPFHFEVRDEERFKQVLAILREYIASIFFIEFADDDIAIENLINIFINEDESKLIEQVIQYGVVYN